MERTQVIYQKNIFKDSLSNGEYWFIEKHEFDNVEIKQLDGCFDCALINCKTTQHGVSHYKDKWDDEWRYQANIEENKEKRFYQKWIQESITEEEYNEIHKSMDKMIKEHNAYMLDHSTHSWF